MGAPDGALPPLSREASMLLARRRRGRNLLMLAVLVGLIVLFYLLAIVKLSHPEAVPPPS